ncbi:hypotheticall protein [Colletotrichum siamense]|nr:hypotheticall protein [Colletotrichum siamense]
MGPFTLFLSSLLFTSALGAPAASGESHLHRDLLLVESFKQKITSDPQGITKNWTGNDVCKFNGFSCDNNPNTGQKALAGIDFNGFGFEGQKLTLDGFLDKLTDLTFFHANSNGFVGQIPSDLSALKWLYELDLSSNKLSGPFPKAVLNADLTFLDLRFNEFSGSIPRELFTLDLDVIFLNDNKFVGSIPDTIGSTPARYITLANNQFSGTFPKSVANAKSLEEILLLGNNLSGSLPTVYKTENLTVFDVGNNNLSGTVPEALCQLKNVQVLNLTSNNFEGALGPACTELVSKDILDISNNCIQGAKGQKPASQCKKA